jgi:hypothetical protein
MHGANMKVVTWDIHVEISAQIPYVLLNGEANLKTSLHGPKSRHQDMGVKLHIF